MKHAIKRIIPILLLLISIFSILWYLTVYDPAFTRDILLKQARFFESKGNHSVAEWLYQQAYQQTGDSENIAIELAEQFKKQGNYTKAEVTLANAISDGGSVELYIALCKTYVEQDKLLDAVTMLEMIQDPQIKAQLEKLRPAAPTVNIAPGFYSQYLTVNVQNSSGKLYVTTDKVYPSTKTQPSNGDVTLVSGENTIYALSVSDNGLVSPLSVFGYTVGGVIEEVVLSDKSIDDLVRQILKLDASATLMSNDLWNITSLTIPQSAATLDDLIYFPYLQSLRIEDRSPVSLAPIATLSNLSELTIRNTTVSTSDLSVIGSLPKLQILTLSACNLSNLSALSNAQHLSYLDLSNNAIQDLSFISFMTKLRVLNLGHNALVDINSLSALSGLEDLNISYNSLDNVISLSNCTSLARLDLSYNSVQTLSGLESLTNLTYLNAEKNLLTDVSQLKNCLSMTQLDVSGNLLTNITNLTALNNLESIDFSRNNISALPTWSKDCALVYVDGSYNQLQTISNLAGLKHLNKIVMDYNNISAVNILVACPNLIQVSVYGNPVYDVSELKAASIIVNYNPV